MNRILLPTDFSKNAWNAISYALELFKDAPCTFYLLHTYTPAIYRADYLLGGPEFSVIEDPNVAESLKNLDQTLVAIKRTFADDKHHFELLSAFNTVTDEVKEVCDTKKIDLIVMGTQGATGAKEIFLGTNTVHVIRKAKVPVLVVPVGYHFQKITRVLFPTDYRSAYKKEEIQVLVGFILKIKAACTVLHIQSANRLTNEQKVNKELLQQYFSAVDSTFVEQEGSLMPNAVHEYVGEHQIAMLAMMNRSHSFLERLLFKQNVDAIGYHTAVPFLVLPDTAPILY